MSSQEPDDELRLAIKELGALFDKFCKERDEIGKGEYGEFTFLENDTIRMLCEELADTANYAKMHFIKLMLFQRSMEEQLRPVNVGANAFQGTGAGWDGDSK